ncbi:MAG: macro domain-containing protein [Mogibacterium sp.]|nr:macro domain-containing protein [Mogibacterium sp.]
MPFIIVRSDISSVSADAIVEAAAPDPLISPEKRHVSYREAADIPAKYIIQAERPVWQGGDHDELESLGTSYRESLLLANSLGCRSIAFPMLSSGIEGFPRDKAIRAALDEIADFLMLSEMKVMLAVPGGHELNLPAGLKASVGEFLDANYIGDIFISEPVLSVGGAAPSSSDTAEFSVPLGMLDEEEAEYSEELSEEEFDEYFHNLYEESRAPAEGRASVPFRSYQSKESLDDVIAGLGKTFQEKLLELIDDKGFSDTQVYKRANMDRKLFSKIRCNRNYKPSKATALALSVALELNLDETKDLIGRAGLAFSPSSKSDLIIQYCLMNGIYDIFDVNALLFEYDQQLLGA